MNLPELRNPFSNGRVISVDTEPAVYHRSAGRRGDKDFIMSRSELVDFIACPSAWIRGKKRKGSDATEWGTLIDCLFLCPEQFVERFSVEPLTYPGKQTEDGKYPKWNNNATFCKTWNKEQGDKQIVSAKDVADSDLAIARLNDDPIIGSLAECSKKQVFVMAEYKDVKTNISLSVKALYDFLPSSESKEFGGCIADLKTCRNGSVGGWSNVIFDDGLHVQAAVYLDICNAMEGAENRVEFLHVVSENIAPFETGRRIMSSEFITKGRETYTHALRFYCECLAANRWPGYDDMSDQQIRGWTLIQPKPWMMMV